MELPPDVWDEFRKHRKKLRKPMTPYAESLILQRLAKLQIQGFDPIEIINISIENGWQGVFAPLQAEKRVGQWWASNAGIEAKAKEIGLHIRAGESYADLKGRIQQKMGH